MNPVIINLIFAGIWLSCGVTLLLHEHMSGRLVIAAPSGINPGWLCILLAAWNLFRAWYNWLFRRRRQRQIEDDEALRRNWKEHQRPEQPPDPNFQFTDGPEPR